MPDELIPGKKNKVDCGLLWIQERFWIWVINTHLVDLCCTCSCIALLMKFCPCTNVVYVINGNSIVFKSTVIWMLFLIDLNLLIMELTKWYEHIFFIPRYSQKKRVETHKKPNRLVDSQYFKVKTNQVKPTLLSFKIDWLMEKREFMHFIAFNDTVQF